MAASCFFLSRRVEGSEMIRWMLVLLSCAVGAFAYLGDRSAIAVLPLLLLNTVHWFFKFMCYDDVNIDFGFIWGGRPFPSCAAILRYCWRVPLALSHT